MPRTLFTQASSRKQRTRKQYNHLTGEVIEHPIKYITAEQAYGRGFLPPDMAQLFIRLQLEPQLRKDFEAVVHFYHIHFPAPIIFHSWHFNRFSQKHWPRLHRTAPRGKRYLPKLEMLLRLACYLLPGQPLRCIDESEGIYQWQKQP